MRSWLYDQLTGHEPLREWAGAADLATMKEHVTPRRAQLTINLPRPFVIYGLGNSTNEGLADDEQVKAERQFFQIWLHDEGATYNRIDDGVEIVKDLFRGAFSKPHNINAVRYLETSQEFNNETYNTIFRYIRFQAIIATAEGAAA